VAWWQRPFTKPHFTPPTLQEISLIFILLAFAVIYFRPHEYILGGADAGGYMNIAATLARTGDFVIQDAWTPVLAEYADVTLRQQPPQWQTRYLQFVGWYIDDADPARVIPQFFPFHPVLIAIGVSLGGLYGGLLVTPLWGVIGLLGVYLLTRKLFDPGIAFLATVLLGITPTHIFFARYPTTEPLVLMLVFAALLAFQHLWDDAQADMIWGVFGGLTLGAATLTRIDLPLFVLLVLVFLIVRWRLRGWSKAWMIFTVTFGILLAHAALSAVLISWPYTWNTYSSVFRILQNSRLIVSGVVWGGLILLSAGLAWKRGLINQSQLQQIINSPKTRWLLVIMVITLSLSAYFLRPILQPVSYYTTWPGARTVPIIDGENWVRIGWYLTPLGLILATAGLAWVVLRKLEWRLGLFLSVSVLTTVQYVYRIFNTPYHIYTMRRYVPIIIPVLMIYAAVVIMAVVRYRSKRSARFAGVALALVFASGLLYQSRYVLPQRDFVGAVAQLTAFEAQLAPDALIIISEPPESDFADRFGTPLRFIWGHDVATIRSDGAELASFIEDMRAYAAVEQRPLQLIAIQPIGTAVRQSLSLEPVTMFPINLQMLRNTFTDYPSSIQKVYYGVEIYNVTDSGVVPNSQTLEIDIGAMDSAFIDNGFYGKEPLPNATLRWTKAEAVLDIPMADDEEIDIKVRAMIFRPEVVAPTPVLVILDGREIGQFTPERDWQTYTFQHSPRRWLAYLH